VQSDTYNHAIRLVDMSSRVVTTLAGLGENAGYADGFGTEVRFNRPYGVALSEDATIALVVSVLFVNAVLVETDSGDFDTGAP
jgi:hypothetical protein